MKNFDLLGRILHSKESNRKISNTLKRKYRSGEVIHPRLNKSFSKASRDKSSISHLGKHSSLKTEIKKGQHLSPKTEFKKGNHPRTEFKDGRSKEEIMKGVITRIKNHSYRIGKEHHNWNNGSSFEPYSPEFNKKLKEQIRQRDNRRCQFCSKNQTELKQILNIHHIDYNKKNNSPLNLISLCNSCHSRTLLNRRGWKRYFNDYLAGIKWEHCYE